MIIKIVNARTGRDVAHKARLAENFWTRAVGLIGKQSFDKGEGLIFPRCNSVHTFFMRFSLDLIFVNKDGVVTSIIENIQKWRISPFISGTSKVIELPTGTIKDSGTMIGDKLLFEQSEYR